MRTEHEVIAGGGTPLKGLPRRCEPSERRHVPFVGERRLVLAMYIRTLASARF